jgi:U3 small nucleolar ribonucleoprotein protein LCP5
LLTNKSRTGEDESGSEGGDVVDETDIPAQKAADADGIYRPPRIAPMPYTGMTMSSKSKSQLRKERPPVPSALSSLLADPSLPHAESTSGLGGSANVASQSSKRAAYLKRITEFEEENFSRLVMKKSEARQRARDEADLALGGNLGAIGGGRRRRVAGGLEDEFGDVLKSVERGSRGAGGVIRGDGYDELRNRGKKGSLIERSRKRDASFAEDGDESAGRTKKRSRFEHETKLAKKKLLKQRR